MAENIDYDPVLLREAAEKVLSQFHALTIADPDDQTTMEAILAPILAEVWADGNRAMYRYLRGSYQEFNPYVKEG